MDLCVQDSEEITNIELADAFQQMWAKRRYNEIFFMIDTCQVFLPSVTGLSSILLAVRDGHLSHI
jgi:glycosylphosphatidylinositol transamidase (GPIT) subunit GPI8